MDKVALVKQNTLAYEWSEKIKACKNSGLTVVCWCRENGINPKTYYYHLRMLRERICDQISVPVAYHVSENPAAIRITHNSGITVEIACGTSEKEIEAVIRALKC